MLEELKEEVYQANLSLVKHGLVLFTWGNLSAIEPHRELVVIKPSGMSYAAMKAEDMVVVDLEGNTLEGALRPSSDTKTHTEIYKAFGGVNAVVHTHSTYATIFAQGGRGLPPYGTTHGDYFRGKVPCTRKMTKQEVQGDYERNTGRLIVSTFLERGINPVFCPSVLVNEHGPFSWGHSCSEAVHNAVVLEEVAKMGLFTYMLKGEETPLSGHVLEKHFYRKHGEGAYYGQN